MCPSILLRRGIALLPCFALMTVSTARASLIAVEYDSGDLYGVSVPGATLEFIGSTGVSELGALEYNPLDGFTYGITTGESAALYRIDIALDPDEVTATYVGALGQYLYEGALAFAPDGTAYAMNGGLIEPELCTIDLLSGAVTHTQPMSERHDFAGLGWRSDGMLIGLDSTENTLYEIDPATAAVTPLASISDPIGSVGGMAMGFGQAYFATAGPDASIPGSNKLYSFVPSTGDHNEIGGFEDTITSGNGISGLTIIPEPASLVLLLLGGLVAVRRRPPARYRIS
jgi:hypothetical protein